jgi:hypothetical protein
MRLRTVCIVLIGLCAVACTSRWSRSDTSQFETFKELQRCQEEATKQFPDGPAASTAAEEQRRASREHAIDGCMKKKGFAYKPPP